MIVETVLESSRTTSDEATLATRFRAGDEAAFEAIVDGHRKMVYAMAWRLLGNHEDADEAAQQAFVRAWSSRSQFRGEGSVGTWLVSIVLNVARSMRRGIPRAEQLDALNRLEDPAESSEARLSRAENRERVRQAVDRLPPRQKEVVMLKVFSELTHREVAEAMELSEGGVKAHLHQAVANLRKLMTPMEDEGEAR